jgi:hypothetical protein
VGHHDGDRLLAQIIGMNDSAGTAGGSWIGRWKAVQSMGCAWKVVVLPWLKKGIRI